ncbi:MAG: acetate--CoA ligase family protein [Pelolinea sp.]|nr:acetate--CoA ligase family protein [Pelolinea sp.]
MLPSLTPFFEPASVAIIGASKNPAKLSNGIVKNMLSNGYKGNIFPINPKEELILGIKCFPSITSVNDRVDLAVIILPANSIHEVIKECGEKGVKAVTVISGGFKEVGKDGSELEKEIITLVKKYHMRMIGPNCVGTMNLTTGLNTTFIRGVPSIGGIGFISQSGAVCGGVVDHVAKQGIGFSHLLSLGNEADVSETDMIEYLAGDKNTTVIAAYIEGIQDGQRFIQVGREVTRSKPVVVLKAGRSAEGAKAVSSHTGSLAGSYDAYKAAFTQGGYFEVHTTKDLLNCAMALDWIKPPEGNRAVIVTNSGGPAALASDSFSDHGIILAELNEETKKSLAEKLNPAAQVDNPVDMLGGAAEDEYAHALEFALADENVDMALAVLVPQSLVDPVKIAQAIIEAAQRSDKPVIACLMGHESVQQAREILHANKIPMIDFPTQSGVMFHALIAHRDNKLRHKESGRGLTQLGTSMVNDLLSAHPNLKFWGEHLTRDVLKTYGLPIVEGRLAKTIPEAIESAQELGYPVVIKGASNDILHKSDARAVAVNIKDSNQLERSYREIMDNMQRVNSKAVIDGLLIEKMAPEGKEVIIGMKRDPSFGPLIMFGIGGIFVELFKDVAFRIAPLTPAIIHQMIESTKAYQLLNGWRGEPAYDIQAIEDALMRLSQLVIENPAISEIEINPLRVLPRGDGALVLDCRMILE